MQRFANWTRHPGSAAIALLLAIAPAQADDAQSNLPAADTSCTKSHAAVDRRAAEAEAGLELQHFGAAGVIVELDELAPVEVIDLQQRLKVLELYRGKVDGIAGPQTRRALQEYFLKQAEWAAQGRLSTSAMQLLTSVPT